MKTILINENNQPVSGVFLDYYRIDGKRVDSESLYAQGLRELAYIDTPSPITESNQVATSQWQITENGYEQIWTIRDKTELELAIEDWDCLEFLKRVSAPTDLAEMLPHIVTYAQVNPTKLRIVPKGDIARIYYNELKDTHKDIVIQFGLLEEDNPMHI